MYVTLHGTKQDLSDGKCQVSSSPCPGLLSSLASEVISQLLFTVGQVQDSDRITASLE